MKRSTANHSFWVTVYFSSLCCSKYWNMGSSKEFSLFFSFFLFFFHPSLYDNREECIMETLNSELWNLNCAGFPFMQLNLEQKAVTGNTKTKESRKRQQWGESLRNPSRSIPKNGRFREGKNWFWEKQMHKKEKGKHTQKMKKQGTEFSAIYRNPSLTW